MNERRAISELERGINRLKAFWRTASRQRKLRKIRVPEHQAAGALALTGFGHLTIDELLAANAGKEMDILISSAAARFFSN